MEGMRHLADCLVQGFCTVSYQLAFRASLDFFSSKIRASVELANLPFAL